MNKNKELPAHPVHPMQDKFGQVVLFSGFSKQEATALQIFKHLLTGIDPDEKEDVNFIIKQSYEMAAAFNDYYDTMNEQKNEAIVMPI